MHLDFPSLKFSRSDKIEIDENSQEVFALVREHCTRLRTIRLSLVYTDNTMYGLDAANEISAIEALVDIDRCLRAIGAVDRIVVDIWAHASRRDVMAGLGWTLDISELEAEDDRGSIWSDGGYRDSDLEREEYDSEDRYDVDDDSDYWRRAGD